MSEEIENAAVNVPRAIVTTMILNGATGFAMVIAVLFCLGDIDSVIVSDLPTIHLATTLIPAQRTHQQDSHSSKHSTTEQDLTLEQQQWQAFSSPCFGALSLVSSQPRRE